MNSSEAIHFYKYQGAGNDFIIIDNRLNTLYLKTDEVAKLCDRRFGIGADGLILLQNSRISDFEMIYYNADGGISTMCGNGGRCIVSFAKKLDIIKNSCIFSASDGLHDAKIITDSFVELKMNNPKDLCINETFCTLDSGSPHYIKFVSDLSKTDVVSEGKKIRYSDTYFEKGINVNFVQVLGAEQLKVYTYERGVEDETLACGTGVTAAAIAFFLRKESSINGSHEIQIKVKGGELIVKFDFYNNQFSNVWLCGPAKFVFEGKIFL